MLWFVWHVCMCVMCDVNTCEYENCRPVTENITSPDVMRKYWGIWRAMCTEFGLMSSTFFITVLHYKHTHTSYVTVTGVFLLETVSSTRSRSHTDVIYCRWDVHLSPGQITGDEESDRRTESKCWRKGTRLLSTAENKLPSNRINHSIRINKRWQHKISSSKCVDVNVRGLWRTVEEFTGHIHSTVIGFHWHNLYYVHVKGTVHQNMKLS